MTGRARIRVGGLRDRVTVQRPTETRAATGQVVRSWADVDTAYARVEYLNAREVYQGEKVSHLAVYRVVIRHRDDVAAAVGKWRLRFEGRAFQIEAAGEADGKREFLELVCVEAK